MVEYSNNNPRLKKKCLICKQKAKTSIMTPKGKKSGTASTTTRYLSKVFFPCEHRCVCNECYDSQQKWTFCPLCNEEIKIAIDHSGGNEVDEYWDWIHEIKPQLPNGFLKSFKRNGRRAVSEAMARSIVEDSDVKKEKGGTRNNDGDDEEQEVEDTRKFTSPHQFHNKDVTDSKSCIIS